LRRGALRVALGLGISTLAIGALHAPPFRHLLMRLGGCPMLGARMTPEQMDNARRISASAYRGEVAAPVRPALGFVLDVTTLADVHAWESREKVACEDERAGLVTCARVPPTAFGSPAAQVPIDELALGFDAHGRLVNVTTLRSHLSPADAAHASLDIGTVLEASLGSAGKRTGAFDTRRLSRAGIDSLATVQYRYRDYFADVTAMNLPESGPSIREHYMSANN
jgi:hypothetical protein